MKIIWDASLLWLRNKNGQPMDTNFLTAKPCYRNMLHIANYSKFEMYLPDEHFETIGQNLGIFTCLIPVEPKLLISDLFFNNYETVRRR